MTLYTNVLPFKLVVRLFDAFLHEDFKIIYRVGLAIIKCKERAIVLTEGFENLMHLLKDFKEPQFQDDDYFISQAFKISLSRNEIKVR
jgi:GTPase-activating protein